MRHEVLQGDVLARLRELPAESVHCAVTSPPYWGLRDYGCEGQIGLEPTPAEYVARMVEVFREVRRVLRDDGVCFINVGDSYFGSTPGSGGKTAKQITNAGSFFSGTRPSRPRNDAPPCGTDGTELLGSLGAGRACPDCGGELTVCSLIHRGRNAGTCPLSEPERQPTSRRARGSERSDCASASPLASAAASRPSTTDASRPNAPDVSCLEGAASELLSETPTSPDNARGCERKSAYTYDTVQSDHPSGDHTTGRVFVCTACGYSTKTHPQLKPKDLVGIPWLLAFALRDDGWYLRSDIIWSKPNPMPESVTDRPTKAHEYIFLLTKSARYFYDAEAVKEPWTCDRDDMREKGVRTGLAYLQQGPVADNSRKGVMPPIGGKKAVGVNGNATYSGNQPEWGTGRNRRTVWTIATQPFTGWTQTDHWVRVEPDAASGGMRRIASPSCRVHGGSSDSASTASCGGHACRPSDHTERNGSCLGPERPAAPVPIETSHEAGSAPDSLGSPGRPSEQPATGRSKRSRKTAPAPSTTSPCTPSDETPSHTGGTSESPEYVATRPGMPESRTWPDEMDAREWDRIAYHTVDRSSCWAPGCTCAVYQKITKEMSHFATYPEALVEPCIKAGCPEGGTVLDPFLGSGTTLAVAAKLGRSGIGIELNPAYVALSEKRIGLAKNPHTWRDANATDAASLFHQGTAP